MGDISSRERYLITMRHEEPDRVPILLDAASPRFFSRDVKWYTQFERSEVLLSLGCDPMVTIWLPTPTIHPEVKITTWREKTPEGKILLGKQFDTPKGPLRQIIQETKDWSDFEHTFWVQRTLGGSTREEYSMHVFDDWNISRRTEPWVKSEEDLEKLPYILQKPSIWQLDEWRQDTQRGMEFAKKHELLTMVRRTVVTDANQWFCDIPWFMMQLYDNPGFVEEFLRLFEGIADWQTELALDMNPDVFQHRGWYDGPDFWGGKHFNKYVLPVINRQADKAHQAGVKHCYLLTEGWGAYFKQFSSLKTDMLGGADPILAKADLKTIKEKIGKEKTILGGISCEHHLINCDTDVTRKATRQAIESLAPGGGFILAASSSIWHEVEWENLSALIDEAANVGRY